MLHFKSAANSGALNNLKELLHFRGLSSHSKKGQIAILHIGLAG